MKTMILVLSLFASVTSFAKSIQLSCQQKPSSSMGAFGIRFNQAGLTPSTQYFRVSQSFWSYAYSSAALICNEDVIDLTSHKGLSCVGYSSAGGLIEATIKFDHNGGLATIHNVGPDASKNVYVRQTDGMVLPCRWSRTEER